MEHWHARASYPDPCYEPTNLGLPRESRHCEPNNFGTPGGTYLESGDHCQATDFLRFLPSEELYNTAVKSNDGYFSFMTTWPNPSTQVLVLESFQNKRYAIWEERYRRSNQPVDPYLQALDSIIWYWSQNPIFPQANYGQSDKNDYSNENSSSYYIGHETSNSNLSHIGQKNFNINEQCEVLKATFEKEVPAIIMSPKVDNGQMIKMKCVAGKRELNLGQSHSHRSHSSMTQDLDSSLHNHDQCTSRVMTKTRGGQNEGRPNNSYLVGEQIDFGLSDLNLSLHSLSHKGLDWKLSLDDSFGAREDLGQEELNVGLSCEDQKDDIIDHQDQQPNLCLDEPNKDELILGEEDSYLGLDHHGLREDKNNVIEKYDIVHHQY